MATERPAKQPFFDPDIIQFPDHPDTPDIATFDYLIMPAYPAALGCHFDKPDTTVILSRVAVGAKPNRTCVGVHFPDLLIAFDAEAIACRLRNGYLIPEQGKPPDFVLEIAPVLPSHLDAATQGAAYAAMGVGEYWQFYPDGSSCEGAPLRGGRLANGRYEPLPIIQSSDEQFWGRSPALNLSICYESDKLRFWNPAESAYLETFAEMVAARQAAKAAYDAEKAAYDAEVAAYDAEMAAHEAERAARRQSEARAEADAARIRQLEAELRLRPNP